MKLKLLVLLTFSIISAISYGQKVKTVTFNTDMRCGHCQERIVAGLKKQPGVLITAIEGMNFKAEVAKKGKKSSLKVEECKGEAECEEKS